MPQCKKCERQAMDGKKLCEYHQEKRWAFWRKVGGGIATVAVFCVAIFTGKNGKNKT